jgi:hypothetical protein
MPAERRAVARAPAGEARRRGQPQSSKDESEGVAHGGQDLIGNRSQSGTRFMSCCVNGLSFSLRSVPVTLRSRP